ncbi:MAG: GntR family transcriptional regulator [Clostridiales bacterium]|nr:GntR family transcriptional regulator [Clostridiales bacterium]
MICFDDFLPQDGVPIYQQILLYLKRGVVSGAIRDGDELPSRRVLSARLGVNPNTVQKAYRMLEEQSLIQSHAGAKSCMVLDEEKTARIRQELLEADTRRIVRAMQQMGITKDEALALIETYWQGSEDL